MSDQVDNPYEILGLKRDAKPAEIKSAYRKLALKYHPDKQKTEEEKQRCTELFTKIGNAYETLSDPRRRAEYDQFGGAAGSNSFQNQQDFGGRGFDSDPFFSGSPFMNDPFFARGGARGGAQHGGFMDPFEIFRSVFGDDFDDGFGDMFHDRRRGGRHDGFGDMMGGMGGMGGLGGHMNMMNNMMNMQSNMQFSSSSSNTFGGGGVSESVSTSTRIINGKRQTITERTIRKPDGTVERTREINGDQDFPSSASLEYGGQPSHRQNNVPYLEQGRDFTRGFFGGRR